jgi:hypothetical protein
MRANILHGNKFAGLGGIGVRGKFRVLKRRGRRQRH